MSSSRLLCKIGQVSFVCHCVAMCEIYSSFSETLTKISKGRPPIRLRSLTPPSQQFIGVLLLISWTQPISRLENYSTSTLLICETDPQLTTDSVVGKQLIPVNVTTIIIPLDNNHICRNDELGQVLSIVNIIVRLLKF